MEENRHLNPSPTAISMASISLINCYISTGQEEKAKKMVRLMSKLPLPEHMYTHDLETGERTFHTFSED